MIEFSYLKPITITIIMYQRKYTRIKQWTYLPDDVFMYNNIVGEQSILEGSVTICGHVLSFNIFRQD